MKTAASNENLNFIDFEKLRSLGDLRPLGIKIENFAPSHFGVGLLLTLYGIAGLVIWCLNWCFLSCLLATALLIVFLVRSIKRHIFLITQYQIRFSFEDKEGWVIQESENTCYRAELKFAYYSKYLVILGLVETSFLQKRKRWFSHPTQVLTVFFDSLPKGEFHRLRKILILLGL